MKIIQLSAAVAASAMVASAGAAVLEVTIENTQSAGGLSLTPFWIAAHGGGFDVYDSGVPATGFPGLEELAELGDTGPLSSAFASSTDGVAGGVDTTVVNGTGAPVFSAGESTTVSFDTVDPTLNRFFSFASMVVPTNDLFVANGDPQAYELFDGAGNFNGPLVIEIFGSDVLDAGTEVNDIEEGGAFVDGVAGTDGLDENGTIGTFFGSPDADTYLDSLVGVTTADGNVVSQAFGRGDLIARITIVPAPGAAALAGLGLVWGARRRR
jgi:uncharacterized protein (TIGR03382 family)